MKRLCLGLVLFFCVIFIFSAIASSQGAPYVSKTFPPDKVLNNVLNKLIKPVQGYTFDKFLGKKRDPDGTYLVFYSVVGPPQRIAQYFRLTKLDSNIWLFSGPGDEWQVLNK
jgi:hypothetical protein